MHRYGSCCLPTYDLGAKYKERLQVNDTPALPRSIIAGAGPQDPNVDQLRAERRELAHWLRLITAKRDLIAARVVPPLTQLQLAGTAATSDFMIEDGDLAGILQLDAPLPSSDDLRFLQRCAAQTLQRIAQLNDQIQAW